MERTFGMQIPQRSTINCNFWNAKPEQCILFDPVNLLGTPNEASIGSVIQFLDSWDTLYFGGNKK